MPVYKYSFFCISIFTERLYDQISLVIIVFEQIEQIESIVSLNF